VIETCFECGATWAVTMTPRERVRCSACALPTPRRWPLRYWESRLRALSWTYTWYRSPAWWDMRTSQADLEAAVELARGLPAGVAPWPMPKTP
jgi:hypothetical protein